MAFNWRSGRTHFVKLTGLPEDFQILQTPIKLCNLLIYSQYISVVSMCTLKFIVTTLGIGGLLQKTSSLEVQPTLHNRQFWS